MAKNYLVTGVTGSGKSTLEKIFDSKGYQTNDIDYGFAEWRNKETGQVEQHNPGSADWLSSVSWCLKVDELKHRLDSVVNKPVLVFGSTNDLDEHLDLFDKVFMLEYNDAETLGKRLDTRSKGGYGKTPHEREAALEYYLDYQNEMKNRGVECIDCTLPIEQIVEIIESEIKND